MRRTMRLLLVLMGKHPLILSEVGSMLECIRQLGWICFIFLSKCMYLFSLGPMLDLYGLHHRGLLPFNFWVGLVKWRSHREIARRERRDDVVVLFPIPALGSPWLV